MGVLQTKNLISCTFVELSQMRVCIYTVFVIFKGKPSYCRMWRIQCHWRPPKNFSNVQDKNHLHRNFKGCGCYPVPVQSDFQWYNGSHSLACLIFLLKMLGRNFSCRLGNTGLPKTCPRKHLQQRVATIVLFICTYLSFHLVCFSQPVVLLSLVDVGQHNYSTLCAQFLAPLMRAQ